MSENGDLPDGWARTTLQQIALIQGGIQKQQKRRPVEKRFPFLRVANVGRGSLDLSELHEVELFDGELERFALNVGDLLVVEGNGSPDQLGRAAMWRGQIENCVHQNHLIRVRPSSALDPTFLLHLWNSAEVADQLRQVASSTSGLHTLSTAKLKRVEIPLPPLAEQRRIVEALEDHLSRLDAASAYLVHARRATSSLEHALRNDILRPWLSVTKKLGALLASPLINGRSVPTNDDGFPVLRLTAIKRGALDLSARKGGDWSREDAAPFQVKQGDFMVSRGNGSLRLVGRGALAVKVPDSVAFPDTMIRVRLDQGVIDTQFLAFIWDSSHVRQQIESAARTTAGIHKINQAILEGIDIPVPPRHEQERIVESAKEQLAGVDRLVSDIELADRHAGRLRRALLAEAFLGKLVPQDPAEEPASEMLARVTVERASLAAGKAKPARRQRTAGTTARPPKKTTAVPGGIQEELPL